MDTVYVRVAPNESESQPLARSFFTGLTAVYTEPTNMKGNHNEQENPDHQ